MSDMDNTEYTTAEALNTLKLVIEYPLQDLPSRKQGTTWCGLRLGRVKVSKAKHPNLP